MKRIPWKTPLALAALLALPVLTNGCSDALPDVPICCNDFKVGADLSNADFGVDADIKGQFGVLAQASSDFSGLAQGMLDDVTNACRSIAQDLGADAAKQDEADKETDGQKRVGLWCQLAVASLQASGAVSGALTIEPPQFRCEASVDAKVDCQAKCSVEGSCNVEATPPKCTGGTMQFECGGKCEAEVQGGSFQCKGKCSAAVKGSCTAQGGVECEGRCEGTCEGSTDAGGNCQGNCKGTCSVTKPGVACNGSFEGECNGSCEATAPSAKVQCSGKCDVKATPLKCEGGKLEGGCEVDAKCDANCDASVSAKASCDVRPFQITANGAASAEIEVAIATLRVNLPKLVLAVKARAETVGTFVANAKVDAVGDVVADPGKLGVKGSVCAVAVIASFGSAVGNAKASLEAGASVTSQVGLN